MERKKETVMSTDRFNTKHCKDVGVTSTLLAGQLPRISDKYADETCFIQRIKYP